jgi:anaerobic sulfite reductase subunit A
MGYVIDAEGLDGALEKLRDEYVVYAPKVFEGGHAFSDLPLIRYGPISGIKEVVFDKKSAFSFKEALLSISQTLFFFTEDRVTEADPPEKGAIVFLRACDLNAVRRLDELYLYNGAPDYYYQRARERIRFVLMGCTEAFDSCFCVDMESNRAEGYDFSVEKDGDNYRIDNRRGEWGALFSANALGIAEVSPSFVTETRTRVALPETVPHDAASLPLWDEYDGRCVNCGRCNFVCPTCTCFTMQDLFYSDNGRAGERRRVWASCMVDGFSDVAGGGSYRQKNGQRIRYKAFHKIGDFKERFGYHMCVGCGRCDDVCPEYISFSATINKLSEALKGQPAGEVK